MKYFAWISLVFMALVSCHSSRIFLPGDEAKVIYESFITGSFEKQTFKAKVSYKEREISGHMLFKSTGDGNYRLAFYSELGLTYLEGTLDTSTKQKKLIVKNIAPIIDHEFFVKSFEKSLQTIFSDKPKPIAQSTNPPIAQSTNPSSFPASPLPAANKDFLIVQLKNGFRLELKPYY
jgi:hypothetical protein